MSVLELEQLHVSIDSNHGVVKAVRGVSLSVAKGETLAIVGESGCGKSVTALSVMGLLPPSSHLQGRVMLSGENLLGFDEAQWRGVRGNRVAMIFQNPMTALNPTMTIGDQIAEPLLLHRGLTKSQARVETIRLLEQLQITDAEQRLSQYPFEFSGGMLQRVMIAISVAAEPDVLIADEPTTALDVTVQAEVLALLQDLQRKKNMALMLITHDLAVVARMAQRVAVMYAGQVVEQGSVDDIFYHSHHPYTQGLKAALPDLHAGRQDKLAAIAGSPPDLISPPKGCGFCQRCPQAMSICEREVPPLFVLEESEQGGAIGTVSEGLSDGHQSRCWLAHPLCPPAHIDFS